MTSADHTDTSPCSVATSPMRRPATPLQALARHGAELVLRDVQPTVVFRRVAELDATNQFPGPGRLEHFVEGALRVRVEIVAHQGDPRARRRRLLRRRRRHNSRCAARPTGPTSPPTVRHSSRRPSPYRPARENIRPRSSVPAAPLGIGAAGTGHRRGAAGSGRGENGRDARAKETRPPGAQGGCIPPRGDAGRVAARRRPSTPTA